MLVMLRAKRWVGSSPICVSWLTPFTPRKPPTRGRGAGMVQWGCQGALHGLGKGRRKCPVECSIAFGWMGPARGPAPAVGHCESSPGLWHPEGNPDTPSTVLRGDEGHLASSDGEWGAVPSIEHAVQQLLLLAVRLLPELCLLLQCSTSSQELL